MRCCSFFVVLLLIAVAFVAGFVVRGGVPSGLPAATALAARARQIAEDAGVRLAATPTAAPAPVPATRGSGAPVVQQSGRGVTVQLDEATMTQQANARLAGQSIGDTPFGAATVRTLAVH